MLDTRLLKLSTEEANRSEVGLTLHLHHLHHHPQLSSCLETPAPSFILNTVCHFSTTRSWPTRPTTQQVEHHPGRSQGVRLCFDRGSTVIKVSIGTVREWANWRAAAKHRGIGLNPEPRLFYLHQYYSSSSGCSSNQQQILGFHSGFRPGAVFFSTSGLDERNSRSSVSQ